MQGVFFKYESMGAYCVTALGVLDDVIKQKTKDDKC